MSNETIFVAQAAFWMLVPLLVFLPIRWSLVAYLLLVQFDLTGLSSYSASSLGVENAIRVVAVPTVLLFRVGPIRPFPPAFARMRQFWLLFTAYAGFAVLWSPYRLSGLKMFGYLYASCVLFVVFTAAWQNRCFTAKSLAVVVWFSLFFALVQTYVLGNDFGDAVLGDRFTSFSGAQSFAPFLLSLFVLLLLCGSWKASSLVSAAAAAVGLVLTGSRSVFLGFTWALVIAGILAAIRSGRRFSLSLLVKRAAFGGAAVVCIGLLVLNVLPDNRLNEMLAAVTTRNASLEDVGTFGWRYLLYEKEFDEIASRGFNRLFTGSGTSSGADFALETSLYREENVDPNRAFHDEFLRSLYEWGLPGFLFLVLFLAEAVRICLRMVRQDGSHEALAFLAICLPLLISLTVENTLAEAAGPAGVGYSLVLTCMVAAGCARADKKRSPAFNNCPPLSGCQEAAATGS
ncbi:MAG: O-antigen ligase family protein [Candidatus Acidiferrum sp.]|jgi:hypothetical protein